MRELVSGEVPLMGEMTGCGNEWEGSEGSIAGDGGSLEDRPGKGLHSNRDVTTMK